MIGRMVLSRNTDEAMVLMLFWCFLSMFWSMFLLAGGLPDPFLFQLRSKNFSPDGCAQPWASPASLPAPWPFAPRPLGRCRGCLERRLPHPAEVPPAASRRPGIGWGKCAGNPLKFICVYIYMYLYIYIHIYILAKRLVSCQCSLELIEVEKSTESWGST